MTIYFLWATVFSRNHYITMNRRIDELRSDLKKQVSNRCLTERMVMVYFTARVFFKNTTRAEIQDVLRESKLDDCSFVRSKVRVRIRGRVSSKDRGRSKGRVRGRGRSRVRSRVRGRVRGKGRYPYP